MSIEIQDFTPAAHATDPSAHGGRVSTGRKIAILGDSIAFYNLTSGNKYAYFFNVANELLGAPFDLVLNAAVSGATPADMISNGSLAAVCASDASVVIVHIGTNGSQTVAESEQVGHITQIWDAIISAGKLVIATPVLPRSDSSLVGSLNALIRREALRRGGSIMWCDFYGAVVDTATGKLKTEYYNIGDEIHPNTTGHHALGSGPMFAVLQPLTSGVSPVLPVSQQDALTSNPLFVAGTTFATGLYTYGSGTPVWSLVARTDGKPGNWQHLDLSGNTGSRVVQISANGILGRYYRAVCEIAPQTSPETWGVTKLRLDLVSGGSSRFTNETVTGTIVLPTAGKTLVTEPLLCSTAEQIARITVQGNGSLRFARLSVIEC